VRQILWELQIIGTAAGDVSLDLFGLVHGATEYQVLVTFTKWAPTRRSGGGTGNFQCYFNWLMPRHDRLRGILHDRYIGPSVAESKGRAGFSYDPLRPSIRAK
jgi:hypothetical protein